MGLCGVGAAMVEAGNGSVGTEQLAKNRGGGDGVT